MLQAESGGAPDEWWLKVRWEFFFSTELSRAVREQSVAVGVKKKQKKKQLLSHVWVLVFRRLAAGGHDQPRHVTPFETPSEKRVC